MYKVKRFAALMITAMIFLNILPAARAEAAVSTFYVSYSSGDDNNEGTSITTPWKTLSRVNTTTFNAGDKILLKCGDTWTGETLIPKGDGTNESMIEIGSYGTGSKPVISNPASLPDTELDYPYAPDARTTVKVGINIKQHYGWKITGIKIQNAEYGITVLNINRPRGAGVWIENCEFNNIVNGRRWVLSDLGNSERPLINRSTAIFMNGFDNLTLKNNTITNVAAGFALQNTTRILVDNVTVYNATDEGAQFVAANNGVIKNISISHVGYPNGVWHGIAGVMFAECQNLTIQDSSIYDITDGTAGVDGVAIDYEAKNKNVTTIRCDIHDCDDAAFLIFDNSSATDNPLMNNYVTNIINNNIYNCGKNNADLTPAFLRHYHNTNSKGVIAGNRVKRYASSQELFKVDGTLTNTYPSNYTYCTDTIYNAAQEFPPAVTMPAEGQSWIASSGFAPTNGSDNWYYLESNGTSSANMTYDTANSRWNGSTTYCLVGKDWQHPDAGPDSVRRWVAPASGVISITGIAKMVSTGGDGVGVMIKKNGADVFSQSLAGTNTTGINTNVSGIRVNAGDRIDFLINKNGSISFDTTFWDPAITWKKASSWTASSDFSSIQGFNDWMYQRVNIGVYDVLSFYMLDWDAANNRWKGDSTYCLVASNYQHPDMGTARDSVRTWAAPRDGTISITSSAVKGSGGNGVEVLVIKNYTQLYRLAINDTLSHPINFSNMSVKQGDTIHFIVRCNGDVNNDATNWNPTITMN